MTAQSVENANGSKLNRRLGSTSLCTTFSRAWLWRAKLAATAHELGFSDLDQFQATFGNSWAYHLAEIIVRSELREYPTLEHALADDQDVYRFPVKAGTLQCRE